MIKDKIVIDKFIEYLRKKGYPTLKIDIRPDENNRKTSDIDAIAGAFAIEHTSIDTITNQRRESKRFLKVVGGLEDEFKNMFPYRLAIIIPYEAIQIGQDWSKVQDSLRTWIRTQSINLADGVHTIKNEPGIPFKFIVRKETGRGSRVIFSRTKPTDDSLPNRIRELFNKKAKKLIPYKNQGFLTILLFESNDVALMNEDIALNAIRLAFSQNHPKGVDKIWYVDTAIPEEILFYDFTEAINRSHPD